MIDYTQKIDLLAELITEVHTIVNEFLTVKCSDDKERENLLDSINKKSDFIIKPKVVGQEKNGLFLFTWYLNECPYGRTFVASYQPSNKFSKLLLYQEKVLNVINASVNIDFTLLAFSCIECSSSNLDHNRNDSSEVYKSYIAEISPQNRVFSLDDEFCTYQKVQFLSEYPQQVSSINKHRLLFFQHKGAIKLYSINVNKYGEKVVVSQQPSTYQIAGYFIWAKFDLVNQRLYFLQLMAQDEYDINASGLMYAVEFHNLNQCQYVVNFLLPIPFKMQMMKKQAVYYNEYLSSIISCKSFNMDVLTTPAGSFFVCFQYEAQSDVQDTSSKLTDEESDDESTVSASSSSGDSSLLSAYPDSTGGNVTYSIVCLHGGYSVKCSSSFPVSTTESSPRLVFSLYNDYLVVHLQDQFMHFLDISCEHEPVHNLLVKNRELLPNLITDGAASLFSNVVSASGQINQMLDNKSLIIFQPELNQTKLMKLFLWAKPRTKLSVLHACINHFKDKLVTKKIMERICQDPANQDCMQMLKEYLLIVPYSHMKLMVNSPSDLKIFPFTTQGFYRGQVERDPDGHRDVYLSYKHFNTNLILQIQKVLQNKEDSFWKNVRTHLKYELNHKNNRVPLKLFPILAVDDDALKSATNHGRRYTDIMTTDDNTSDCDYSVVSFATVSDDNALDQDVKENERLNNLATECIVKYIAKNFGSETKGKASKMCHEYMERRNKTIMSLWKIVVKSLNNTDESIRYKKLTAPIDEYELAIFQILERLKVILDQLCYPRLPRMANLLTTMGFRCLSRGQFFSYLDAEVFNVDLNWVRYVVRELLDTPENLQVKENLIMRLTKAEAQKILVEWNHPVGNQYLAKQLLPRLSNDMTNVKMLEELQNQRRDDQFVPLETLISAVKSHGKPFGFLRQRTDNPRQKEKIQLLTSSALAETKSLIS